MDAFQQPVNTQVFVQLWPAYTITLPQQLPVGPLFFCSTGQCRKPYDRQKNDSAIEQSDCQFRVRKPNVLCSVLNKRSWCSCTRFSISRISHREQRTSGLVYSIPFSTIFQHPGNPLPKRKQASKLPKKNHRLKLAELWASGHRMNTINIQGHSMMI